MVGRSSRLSAASARQSSIKKKQPPTKTLSREINSLDHLKAVQYRIFHDLKIDHPRTLLKVDKHLNKELVPAVYKDIQVSGNGFYKLLRVSVKSKRRNASGFMEPVYNPRMVEALKHTSLLNISDFGDYKELHELLSLCKRPIYGECKNDLIFPSLNHVALGSNTLEGALEPDEFYEDYEEDPEEYEDELDDEKPRPYTGTERLEIVQILMQIWSVQTLCIDWPKISTVTTNTDILPKKKTSTDFDDTEGEPEDVILDWYLVELLDHFFPLDTKFESIKIHLRITDLGNLLHRLLDYKPQFWEGPKPRIILDFIYDDEKSSQSVYFTVMVIYITVIRAMKDYDYQI